MAAEAKLRATTAGVVQLLQNFTHFFTACLNMKFLKVLQKSSKKCLEIEKKSWVLKINICVSYFNKESQISDFI